MQIEIGERLQSKKREKKAIVKNKVRKSGIRKAKVRSHGDGERRWYVHHHLSHKRDI